MTLDQPTTAKHGNPGQASRGAAVSRARKELLATFDAIIHEEECKLTERLAKAIECEPAEVQSRIDGATLDQLKAWTAAMGAEMERRVA